MIYILITYLILILIVIFWQGSLLWATAIGSPIVWSYPQAVSDCMKLAEAKQGQTVVDLGCGNCKTLIHAVKEFKVKGIGIDRSFYCFLLSKFNVWRSGESKNIKVVLGDFKKAKPYLKKADIIYLYLLHTTLAQIEEWFFKTIGEKTRVVSLAFFFPNHKPIKECDTYTLGKETKARLYRN
jgi:ubiquinone/menaquinone biosynthesis C-methylase UbiE